MNNLGSKWLDRTNMQQSPCMDKVCALAALEMSLDAPVGTDTFSMVWDGNLDGSVEAMRSIRHCMFLGSSVPRLLDDIHVPRKTLTTFLEEVRSVG